MTGAHAIPARAPRTRALTLALYWGSLASGLLLPLLIQFLVEMRRQGGTFAQTFEASFDAFFLRLFAPGDGTLFVSLIGAAPFAVYAVFTLFHLGTAPRHGSRVVRRRRFAVLASFVSMLAVSAWGLHAIASSSSSTAALGYLVLPAYVLVAMLLGYGFGALLALRLDRRARPEHTPL